MSSDAPDSTARTVDDDAEYLHTKFDGPAVAQMEEDDELYKRIKLGPIGRQALENDREMARRRPVTHPTVHRLEERVSLVETLNSKTNVIKIQKESSCIRKMFNAVLVQDFPEKRDIVDPEFKCFL